LYPKEYEALSNQTSNLWAGLRMELKRKKPLLTVLKDPYLALTTAGIKAGIVGTDGNDQDWMQDASSLIRGKVGTPDYFADGGRGRADFEAQLTRAIQLPSVLHNSRRKRNRRVGYIRMWSSVRTQQSKCSGHQISIISRLMRLS